MSPVQIRPPLRVNVHRYPKRCLWAVSRRRCSRSRQRYHLPQFPMVSSWLQCRAGLGLLALVSFAVVPISSAKRTSLWTPAHNWNFHQCSHFDAYKTSGHIKVAPRDELWGYLECVPLAGIEPATYLLVKESLYPLSYSGTQSEGY